MDRISVTTDGVDPGLEEERTKQVIHPGYDQRTPEARPIQATVEP